MAITLKDAQAFLHEAEHFAQQRVAHTCQQHEHPISAQHLYDLSMEAFDLGFLPNLQQKGFALWDDMSSAGSMTFNIGFLQTLAQTNASLAFAWHRHSLAIQLLRSAKKPVSTTPSLSVSLLSTGRFGLGRHAFAYYLSADDKETPNSDMQLLLADWLDRTQPAVLVAPEQWESVVWPVWQDDGIKWQWITREQLQVTAERRQHGFDELEGYSISTAQPNATYLELPGSDKDQASQVLKQDFIGMLAIAAGSLKRAALATEEFTALRQQGGSAINQHPAVQQMLCDIDGALFQVEQSLQGLCKPLKNVSLKEVFHHRLTLQPLLCHAANQAMQAHGGVGYMQDVGIEKVLREQNMLRVLAGGLLEMPLAINALRR